MEIPWKSHGNSWKFMEIHGNPMEIHGNSKILRPHLSQTILIRTWRPWRLGRKFEGTLPNRIPSSLNFFWPPRFRKQTSGTGGILCFFVFLDDDGDAPSCTVHYAMSLCAPAGRLAHGLWFSEWWPCSESIRTPDGIAGARDLSKDGWWWRFAGDRDYSWVCKSLYQLNAVRFIDFPCFHWTLGALWGQYGCHGFGTGARGQSPPTRTFVVLGSHCDDKWLWAAGGH